MCVVYMANTTRRSIELEPKTLSQGQLSHARKVAADVVQKMEPKGASALFTEGLEHSSEEEMTEVDEEEEHEEKDVEEIKPVGCIEKIEEKIEEKVCNMNVYSSSSSSVMVDSSSSSDQLHHIHQHEPLSAPF
ncbi:hypothetical protein K1719_021170 [Acacia pycnantha]|nr:hypothetical protein K1719_021170 [Acacia pycnantha]